MPQPARKREAIWFPAAATGGLASLGKSFGKACSETRAPLLRERRDWLPRPLKQASHSHTMARAGPALRGNRMRAESLSPVHHELQRAGFGRQLPAISP